MTSVFSQNTGGYMFEEASWVNGNERNPVWLEFENMGRELSVQAGGIKSKLYIIQLVL